MLRNKSNMMNHLKIHTGVKAFKCDLCDKKFADKSNMKRHLQIHAGEKSFKCDLCKKSLYTSCNFDNAQANPHWRKTLPM